MKKGNLTRDEAIAAAGLAAVMAVDTAEPWPTNRVGYNGACQGDDFIEYKSCQTFRDAEGFEALLYAYYYIEGEPDGADWDVHAYEIA